MEVVENYNQNVVYYETIKREVNTRLMNMSVGVKTNGLLLIEKPRTK